MPLSDHIGCQNTKYHITLQISTMDTPAINSATVMILSGALYSTDPHEILSVLPQNSYLLFPN